MPAYNGEKYISESIMGILNQTFKYFEFIIVDDGSTDCTWTIINEFAKNDNRIILLKNERNLKLSKTLNKAINIARGEYIARIDCDDWSYPYRLEKQYEFMENNLEVGILGSSIEIINPEGKIIGKREYELNDPDIRKKIFKYSPFCHSSVIIRKSVLNKSGLYDPYFNPAEDYELYFRIGRYSKFANLKDVLLKYKVVGKSMTNLFTRQMELLTVDIRNKYSQEYEMNIIDKIYNIFHYISIFIIPTKFRVWFFNLFRNI